MKLLKRQEIRPRKGKKCYFLGDQKFSNFKNISLLINLCLKYFLEKLSGAPAYIVNIRSLTANDDSIVSKKVEVLITET